MFGSLDHSAAFGLIAFGALVVGVGLTFHAAQASVPLAIGVVVLLVLGVLLLGIWQAALSGVYSAIPCRHARSHQVLRAFQGVELERAFAPKA